MIKSQNTMEEFFGEKTTSLEAWKLRLDDGERAYYKHMNWEAVRNLISSQK